MLLSTVICGLFVSRKVDMSSGHEPFYKTQLFRTVDKCHDIAAKALTDSSW